MIEQSYWPSLKKKKKITLCETQIPSESLHALITDVNMILELAFFFSLVFLSGVELEGLELSFSQQHPDIWHIYVAHLMWNVWMACFSSYQQAQLVAYLTNLLGRIRKVHFNMLSAIHRPKYNLDILNKVEPWGGHYKNLKSPWNGWQRAIYLGIFTQFVQKSS